MSSTNGAGEPSMEEILASIRNIIAQEPGEETPEKAVEAAQSSGAASSPSGPGLSPAPVSESFTALPSRSPAPDGRSASGGLSERLQQSAGTTGGPMPNASTSAPADDFSDVFDEPLKQVPLASSPFSVTPASSGLSNPSPVPSANSPQLPNGSASGSGPTVIAKQEPMLPTRGETSVGNFGSDPVLPKKNDETDAPKPASGFDFGALRPRRAEFEAEKPAEAEQPSLEEPSVVQETLEETIAKLKAKSAAQQAQLDDDETAEADTASVASSADAQDAGKPVVIAAMPTKPSAAEPVSAEKSDIEAGAGDEPESKAEATDDHSESGEDTPAPTNGAASLVNGLAKSNVGFLANLPRSVDSDKGDGTAASSTAASLVNEFSGNLSSETPSPEADDDAKESVSIGDASEESSSVELEGSEAKDEVSAETASSEATSSASEANEPSAPAPASASADVLSVANIVVSNQGGAVKTLEDTVAELLRPLLREWLENNMPRIVENALRLEVADSVKKQLDVATRKPNGLDHK